MFGLSIRPPTGLLRIPRQAPVTGGGAHAVTRAPPRASDLVVLALQVRDHPAMATLILLRHGESQWGPENRFTGWVDVGLTDRGAERARRNGDQLRAAGLLPDVLHTSLLRRAVRTGNLVLEGAGLSWVPVHKHWRLNERAYGALQGRTRTSVVEEFGAEQYQRWRRSYDAAPPPVEPGSAWDVSRDPRYARLARELVPRTESLADVVARLLPYWYDAIVPDLQSGADVLVTAHSNSLRALIAHLDGLSRSEVLRLNVPTGMPLLYDLDDDLVPRQRGGRYLEREAAARAASRVADQGTSP